MDIYRNYRAILGESPIWHPIKEQFYWVDILKKNILSLSKDNQSHESFTLPDKVGCIVPSSDGQLLAALSDTLVKIDFENKIITPLCDKLLKDSEMFNDGKVDARGRLWVASKDINESQPLAKLYMYDGKHFVKKESGLTVGNGIDWNNDNSRFYLADSPKKVIYEYDFNLMKGEIKNRGIFAKINQGYPDGLTIDSENCLWNCHWDGNLLTRYNPEGEVIDTINMPQDKPTSLCFGGNDLNKVFITSAAIEVENPKEDGYLSIHNQKTKGRPANVFDVASL